MAPTRLAVKPIAMNENLNGILTNGITTRSKQTASLKGFKDNLKVPNKRKADSPLKDVMAKRAAFGDLTNAFNKSTQPQKAKKVLPVKKVTVESKMLPAVKTIKPQNGVAVAVNGKTSKAKQLQKVATTAIESVQKHFAKEPPKVLPTRGQNGILKNIERKNSKDSKNSSQNSAKSARSDTSEPSLYTTALENISPADSTKEEYKTISEKLETVVLDDTVNRSLVAETELPHCTPQGVADFDKENWNDPYQVSHYAMDIFNYMKGRERVFPIDDYLTRMKNINSWMRSLLVDWMVEVQESFELNHETLYLAVKLVDLYLARASKTKKGDPVAKEELQLLGASSLFIASKYDERVAPLVDDFLYICDGAYNLRQLLAMEVDILRALDFDLGVPLSYRFLRRYARCARVSMPTLTLARFVLESCLLDYSHVARSDSQLAAAALYIALTMKDLGGWTPALTYYTGYSLADILPVALALNATLHKTPKSAILTVRNKYSHTIFFEVAQAPLASDEELCEQAGETGKELLKAAKEAARNTKPAAKAAKAS